VALDPPPCANAGEMRHLLAVARRTGQRLWILPTRRVGTDFRTALQIVRGDQLGRIDSARLISWGKAVPHAAGTAATGDRSADREPFAVFAYQYVDQLLQLIGGRPRSVFGRILAPGPSEAASTVFTLAIAFEPGVDALIDVNLQSGAVLQTGWMLAGARGGYSGGRIYLRESTGEISDASVSQSDRPDVDVYGELVASARSEPGPMASASDAEIVMRVIDAARESSRSGQSVSIEP
jgi:predicted dehydrogenase